MLREQAVLPRFNKLGAALHDTSKTGLGSSAALTASVVGALSLFLGIVPPSTKEMADPKGLVFRMAQLCHCLAQNKLGSGFDVSAAIVGSQMYRRFSPEIIGSTLKVSPCTRIVSCVVLLVHWLCIQDEGSTNLQCLDLE